MRRRPDDDAVLDLFRHQSGVITREQALASGLTRRQIEYCVERRRWLVVRRGVYRHPLFEPSDTMMVMALTLGGNGHASHRYAAELHGLEPRFAPRGAPVRPELTVRRGSFVHEGGLLIHESTQMDWAEVEFITGIPVSGVERTILDVAAVVPHHWKIVALIDHARRRRMTDLARLVRCLERHQRRGRDGTVRFREAIALASARTTPAIGHLSRKATALLGAAGLPVPFFEEPIFDASEFLAQVDLSWIAPVVAFLDGFEYHDARRYQTNRDRRVRQRLRAMGLWVLEFTHDQLWQTPGFVTTTSIDTFRQAERAVLAAPGRYRWWTQRPVARLGADGPTV